MTTLEHLRARICERCNGGGYIATKHGPKRCPFCNPGRQPIDRGYVLLGIGVYVALIALAIVGGM